MPTEVTRHVAEICLQVAEIALHVAKVTLQAERGSLCHPKSLSARFLCELEVQRRLVFHSPPPRDAVRVSFHFETVPNHRTYELVSAHDEVDRCTRSPTRLEARP